MNIKRHHLFSSLVLVVILILMFLKDNPKFQSFFDSPALYVNERIDSKKLNDQVPDLKIVNTFKEDLNKDLNDLLKTYRNSTKKVKENIEFPNLDSDIVEIVDKYVNKLRSEQESKNNVIYKLEKDNIKSSAEINYPLIILIIFVSGLLGGYARRYYNDLTPLLESSQELQDDTTQMLNQISSINAITQKETDRASIISKEIIDASTKVTESLEGIREKTKELKFALKELITSEEDKNTIANLVYGVIAASLSILGLNMAESKVLNFTRGVDYLIFWGWATIFAVFSKSIVEALANKIKDKIKPSRNQ